MPHADPEKRRQYARERYLRNREARLKYEADRYRRENPDAPRINDTCKRGHSLADAPIREDNGQRVCVPCREAYSREYYERNRDKVKAATAKRQRENLPEIRAMLCSFCNTALGMASDDPERLRALAAYLEKYSQPRFEVPSA